ncbi:MAG: hypothetical protein ACFB2Z_10485 [Maricaulaceae bacterium]
MSFEKFAFDRVFSADGRIIHDPKGDQESFSQTEIDQARAQARREGERSGVVRAEKAAADALQALAQQAAHSLNQLNAVAASHRADAARLGLAAARAVAGSALDRFGEDRAAAIIEAALGDLNTEARVVVRLNPQTAKTLSERIGTAFAQAGLDDRYDVRTDAQAGPGDVSVDWTGGAIFADAEDAQARIDSILKRHIEADAMEASQLDMFAVQHAQAGQTPPHS